MDVRRLIVNAVPPSRATRTGRNGDAELTTPIAIESERMIRALWMVSDADGRPGLRRDRGTEGGGRATGGGGRGEGRAGVRRGGGRGGGGGAPGGVGRRRIVGRCR